MFGFPLLPIGRQQGLCQLRGREEGQGGQVEMALSRTRPGRVGWVMGVGLEGGLVLLGICCWLGPGEVEVRCWLVVRSIDCWD